MNSLLSNPVRCSLVVFVIALYISGCSGSSDSPSFEQSDIDAVSDSNLQIDVDGTQNANDTGSILSDDTMADAPSAVDTESTFENESPSSQPQLAETVEPSSVMPDPLIQNRTQVNFEITVPAYQSNQLRVELDWGNVNLSAMWVGDEFWSVTGDFPTNTENLLLVNFYDLDGDIELARFSQEFTTGSNAAESVQIPVDQFEADLFDADEDGVNNLDELIAGTDPLVDEDSLLPINDFAHHSRWSRMSVSRHFEAHVSDARPYVDTSSVFPNDVSFGTIIDVDIDPEGNGTLTHDIFYGSQVLGITGTRTTSENSVSWEGFRWARDDFTHSVSVNNTITYIDENTRGFVEESEGSNIGTFTDTWESSSNLIGRVVEGTSFCEPVAGTFTTTNVSNRGPSDNYTITYSKDIDDQYWRFVSGTEEYFVRELIMLRSFCGTTCGSYTDPEPEDKYFRCDFVDL